MRGGWRRHSLGVQDDSLCKRGEGQMRVQGKGKRALKRGARGTQGGQF